MKRTDINICLVAVISLLFGAIWHVPASAAVAPAIVPLGEIHNAELLTSPGRIDVDAVGSIYVTDARKKVVVKFDKYGQFAHKYSAIPASGRGVAVSPDGSRVYVSGTNLVAILDGASGELVGYVGAGAGEFVMAGEIDLDASGYIFVADAGARVIKVYNGSGVFQYQFGGFGIAPGQFRTIWAMSVDESAGEVYAADVETYSDLVVPKVQVFDLAGNLKRALSSTTGFGTPAMTFFGGMTFDQAGRGYFLDTFRSFVRVLGLPSAYLSNYDGTAYVDSFFQNPVDAVFDPTTSRLFVTCDGSRIEILGVDGGQNPVNANVAPGQPAALSPVADSEVASATPVLLYQNAVDPDGNTLTYEVKVLKDGEVVAQYASLPEDVGTSSVKVDVALEENRRYQWTVQASDGKDVSGWTALQSFFINATDESPTAPVLTAPLAGEVLDGEGTLSWQAATDPDPFDSVGYFVEISSDPSFATLVMGEAVADTSAVLSQLADYASLDDGVAYFWRVKAVDNDSKSSEPSAAGEFVYDTTLLKITANVPGAKVYLGGNFGYDGRYVGQVPVELRDFPVGTGSIVVEKAGMEPVIVQVRPVERENVSVHAKLRPAIVPADLKARPLQALEEAIVLGGDAAPFAVDYDNDGLIDLLVGDASGALTLYKGALTAEGLFYYTSGVSLGLTLTPGAAPFVADWDNDGRKDLLVGSADGSILLYLNTGSEEAPAFGAASYLQANGVPVSLGASAVPVVVDLDGDGDKDLLAGSASGAVAFLRNDGSDEAPLLVAAGNVVKLSSPVAPCLTDWDADGVDELLLAASEHVYVYERQAGVAFAASGVLAVADALAGGGGKTNGNYSLGDRLRLFAVDADEAKGKDIIVGNAAGQVRLVGSTSDVRAVAFTGALLDKVGQIDEMARETAPELAPIVESIRSAIVNGDAKNAKSGATKLVAAAAPGTELAFNAAELTELLK